MEDLLLALSLFVPLLGGCQNRLVEDEADGARYLYGTARTRSSGLARACIDVIEGDTSMLVTAGSDSPFEVFVRRLTAPDGEDVLLSSDFVQSDQSKTNAIFVNGVSSLNWPIDDVDRPLEPGCWRVEVGVVDPDLEFVDRPATLDVLLKGDNDLFSGTLDVALIYTDDLRTDQEVVTAVDGATELWRDMYDAFGVQVRFSTFELDENGLLPPAFGDEERYRAIATDTPTRTINLILSDVVIHEGAPVLGIAGDIPGPLVPTNFSSVQLSLAEAAGMDGSYQPADIRLLAETMAHETAHFLGLFHPVERDEWSQFDALEDTQMCSTERVCENRLGDNLLFPYPVCVNNVCTPQSALTEDQQGVLHRAVAVR